MRKKINPEEAFNSHKEDLAKKFKSMTKQVRKEYSIHSKGVNKWRINRTIRESMASLLSTLSVIETQLEKLKLRKTDIVVNPDKYKDLFKTDEEIKREQAQAVIQRILIPLESVNVSKTEDVQLNVS